MYVSLLALSSIGMKMNLQQPLSESTVQGVFQFVIVVFVNTVMMLCAVFIERDEHSPPPQKE